jgi:hypothetical protein
MNRETDQADGVDAGSGSVSGRGARSAKLGQDPMNRETDQADGVDARVGVGPRPPPGRALGPGAWSAKCGQAPILCLPHCACHRALVPTGAAVVVASREWSPPRTSSGGMTWRATGDDASRCAPRAPRWILPACGARKNLGEREADRSLRPAHPHPERCATRPLPKCGRGEERGVERRASRVPNTIPLDCLSRFIERRAAAG